MQNIMEDPDQNDGQHIVSLMEKLLKQSNPIIKFMKTWTPKPSDTKSQEDAYVASVKLDITALANVVNLGLKLVGNSTYEVDTKQLVNDSEFDQTLRLNNLQSMEPHDSMPRTPLMRELIDGVGQLCRDLTTRSATPSATATSKPSNLTVQYSVEDIPNKGKGLVSRQFIPKGTCVWKPNPQAFQTLLDIELYTLVMGMENIERRHVLSHVYGWNGKTIRLLDDSQFTNHSSNPNMGMIVNEDKNGKPAVSRQDLAIQAAFNDGSAYALRDIQIGEELTEDYTTYECSEAYLTLCAYFLVDSTLDIAKRYK